MKFAPVQMADRLGIVGISGSGKSHCGKALLAREMKTWRVLCYDLLDEFSQDGKKTKAVTLGPLKHRVTFGQFASDPDRWMEQDKLSLSIVPMDEDSPADCAKEVEYIKSEVKTWGDVLVYLSELGAYAGHCVTTLKTFATMGRHWGCPMVFESQRMVHIPPDARAQLTQLESFLQDHPADLDALRERTKLSDPTFADRVARLAVGESELWRSTLHRKEAPKC